MDSPDREPGVTMMNYDTGNGTAKYWVTRLVIESTQMGDIFRNTTVSGGGGDATRVLYAQAFTHTGETADDERRVLLVNKQNAVTTVMLAGATDAQVVDENTGDGPPRKETGLGGKITLSPFATAMVTVTP